MPKKIADPTAALERAVQLADDYFNEIAKNRQAGEQMSPNDVRCLAKLIASLNAVRKTDSDLGDGTDTDPDAIAADVIKQLGADVVRRALAAVEAEAAK